MEILVYYKSSYFFTEAGMNGLVGYGSNPGSKAGFLYSIPWRDRHSQESRWINHPAQCLERCRTVDTAVFAIVKNGDPYLPWCACANKDFTDFTKARGYYPGGEQTRFQVNHNFTKKQYLGVILM